eukprot:TRINITY_DN7495_c0_g2_i1.p1 TRINITY_DN7495_c0_g2~~TRINITY_DN7495_c0_g2_i1.p1  ORF type:complete len:686 (+),score=158.36 TRINITY_DN7495_c0_g2_i1:100-2157(+)
MRAIFVRMPSGGEVRSVEVAADAVVVDLQRAAAGLVGREAESVALSFAGRVLDDPSEALADAGIGAEATVELTLTNGWAEWLTMLGVNPAKVINPAKPGVVNLSGKQGMAVARFLSAFAPAETTPFSPWLGSQPGYIPTVDRSNVYASIVPRLAEYNLATAPSAAEALQTYLEQSAASPSSGRGFYRQHSAPTQQRTDMDAVADALAPLGPQPSLARLKELWQQQHQQPGMIQQGQNAMLQQMMQQISPQMAPQLQQTLALYQMQQQQMQQAGVPGQQLLVQQLQQALAQHAPGGSGQQGQQQRSQSARAGLQAAEEIAAQITRFPRESVLRAVPPLSDAWHALSDAARQGLGWENPIFQQPHPLTPSMGIAMSAMSMGAMQTPGTRIPADLLLLIIPHIAKGAFNHFFEDVVVAARKLMLSLVQAAAGRRPVRRFRELLAAQRDAAKKLAEAEAAQAALQGAHAREREDAADLVGPGSHAQGLLAAAHEEDLREAARNVKDCRAAHADAVRKLRGVAAPGAPASVEVDFSGVPPVLLPVLLGALPSAGGVHRIRYTEVPNIGSAQQAHPAYLNAAPGQRALAAVVSRAKGLEELCAEQTEVLLTGVAAGQMSPLGVEPEKPLSELCAANGVRLTKKQRVRSMSAQAFSQFVQQQSQVSAGNAAFGGDDDDDGDDGESGREDTGD